MKRPADSPHSDGGDKSRTHRVSELQAQLVDTQRVLEAFRDIAAALAEPTDIDCLLELVLQRAKDLLCADRATLYLLDDITNELVGKHVVGGCEQEIRVAVGEGIAGSVVQTGTATHVENAYEDPRFDRSWDARTGYHTRSILAVPMKSRVGQTIGVLQVLNKMHGAPFTPEDEGLLGALGTQAAISIDNFKLFHAVVEKNKVLARIQLTLERKVDFLKLLVELQAAMARASDQRQLVRSMLSLIVAGARTKAGAVLLLSPHGPPHEAFVVRVEEVDRDSRQTTERHTEHQIDHIVGTFAKTLQQRQTVCLRNVRRRSASASDLTMLGLQAKSILAVPMLGDEGEPWGALVLYDRWDGQPFCDDDQELLRLVAANASTAMSLLRSRESQRMSDRLSTIGSLLSGVLHDLKTPMAVISGYMQLMATTSSETKRQEYSELVLRQFEHITSMQREVLAFAKGERSILLSKVYLQKFFEEFRGQLERELDGRGVALQLELRDRGIARFDQSKVARALYNLTRNALDAMGKGGTLRIVVEREGSDLLLRVRDTGPGIPDQVRGRLFESFVSAQKANGTGLGLAIVKKIAEEHGGRVEVTSSSEGAEFVLRLPQV